MWCGSEWCLCGVVGVVIPQGFRWGCVLCSLLGIIGVKESRGVMLGMGDAVLFTEIDHVAIAVNDLEAAIFYYSDTFGATVHHREVVEFDGAEEALLRVADSYIQLLTPICDDSPVAKFLGCRGEGLHHVGYRVTDCGVALEVVCCAGHRVIDEVPRPGSRGTTVAFMHPKDAFGTLIELV